MYSHSYLYMDHVILWVDMHYVALPMCGYVQSGKHMNAFVFRLMSVYVGVLI